MRVYTVDLNAFAPVRDWIEQMEGLWNEQLQAFKEHAERTRRTRKPGS